MRRYETIAIVDPDVSPELRVPLFDRCGEIIGQHGGQIVEVDEWGARQLAYEIKKKKRGYYVLFNYCGDGDVVQEMERFFRIDDRILKFMTVLLEKEVDMEQIKEEIAGAEAEKAAEEQPPAEQAAEESEKAEKEHSDEERSDAAEPETGKSEDTDTREEE